MRVRRLAASLIVFVAAACGDSVSPTGGASGTPQPTVPSALSADARNYLNAALDTMQKYSYYRATINWQSVRTRAIGAADAAHAQTIAATYPAIRGALADLGDHHSFLQAPVGAAQAAPANQAALFHPADSLDGEIVGERYGYVRVPTFAPVNGGSPSQIMAFADTLQGLVRAVDAKAPCGWIVDLRHNGGGNMWPMLVGIGPILGEGDNLGAFVDANAFVTHWFYRNGFAGTVSSDNTKFVSASTSKAPYVVRVANAPVAVLTDRFTASSGEAITVAFRGRPNTRSFGAPTYGVPTANAGHPLVDGAYLWLMSALDADRAGTQYIDPLPPDEMVDTSAPPATDDVVALTAMRWLASQTSCKN